MFKITLRLRLDFDSLVFGFDFCVFVLSVFTSDEEVSSSSLFDHLSFDTCMDVIGIEAFNLKARC